MNEQLTLTLPDDWHIHLRDEAALQRTANDAAKQFGRVLVMPNLVPPITTVPAALAYRSRILNALDGAATLDPKMALYLTDSTSTETVIEAAQNPHVLAFKWYPAGATTNSASGVTSRDHINECLAEMERQNVVLCVHGEVTDSDIDIFDREAEFIERTLKPVTRDFPALRIVFEHITTREAVEFVQGSGKNIAATITAHHLLYNRNAMLAGGIRPHYYCLPILKRDTHQQALIAAATSGSSQFFLGSDSAPHSTQNKETSCGCAGSYTAHAAMELYTEVFAKANALDKLEAFSSQFGATFYGLEANQEIAEINKQPWRVPNELSLGDTTLTPLCAGEQLSWTYLRKK